jgi:hypothetical protein
MMGFTLWFAMIGMTVALLINPTGNNAIVWATSPDTGDFFGIAPLIICIVIVSVVLCRIVWCIARMSWMYTAFVMIMMFGFLMTVFLLYEGNRIDISDISTVVWLGILAFAVIAATAFCMTPGASSHQEKI